MQTRHVLAVSLSAILCTAFFNTDATLHAKNQNTPITTFGQNKGQVATNANQKATSPLSHGATSIGGTGAKGATGIVGPRGVTGPTGQMGATGPTGSKGATGSTGLMGLQGLKGDKGDPGVAGVRGVPGPQGNAGSKGETGAVGPKGETGAIGPKGETGAIGPKGDTGSTGPKGDTGATGAKGDTGAVGSKGDTGAVGPKGETGAIGPKGETGAIGPKGDTGSAGPKGDTGTTGAKGDTGAVGPKGETGAVGPKGETGAIGPKGETGAIGPKGEVGVAGAAGSNAPVDCASFYLHQTNAAISVLPGEAIIFADPPAQSVVGIHSLDMPAFNYDGANGQFTINETGTYMVFYGAAAIGQVNAKIALKKTTDGTGLALEGTQLATSMFGTMTSGVVVLHLDVSDVIELVNDSENELSLSLPGMLKDGVVSYIVIKKI